MDATCVSIWEPYSRQDKLNCPPGWSSGVDSSWHGHTTNDGEMRLPGAHNACPFNSNVGQLNVCVFLISISY